MRLSLTNLKTKHESLFLNEKEKTKMVHMTNLHYLHVISNKFYAKRNTIQISFFRIKFCMIDL